MPNSRPQSRIARVIGAVNVGSFRIAAMIAGVTESGELLVLGSGHRAAQGVKRGYVIDMRSATYAIRDAIERAEKMANTSVSGVWVGTAGAGLASQIAQVELPIGGRRVEPEDIRHLLLAARDVIQPEGRGVLQAQPAHYTLDGAHGVADPQGLHAQSLGVDIHVLMADAAPLRNLTESVQNAHLQVEEVVGSPVAAGIACLSEEERELGVALVEFGAEVTSVSLFAGGMLVGLACLPSGSGDITDAIASSFGIRRFQAERLKCVNGSAIATPADHREMIPIAAPGDEAPPPASLHADERGRISRADLIAVITSRLGLLMEEINKALKAMGYTGVRGAQVVFTGGGAELAGLAEFAQGALGRPVRIGRPVPVKGLPEAHTTPGYSALVGLVLQAAAQPLDIRRLAPPRAVAGERGLQGQARRILRALRDYF